MAFKSEPLMPGDTLLEGDRKGFDPQRCYHLNSVLPRLKREASSSMQ